MSKQYELTREGNGRTLVHVHRTSRQARESIGHSLHDNGHADKRTAQSFAATVLPDGAPKTYGPYTFTMIRKDVADG